MPKGNVDPISSELLGAERVQHIDWSHPTLAGLSAPARLIYACLIDGCSEDAVLTIAGVDLVWQNRDDYARIATPLDLERSETCEAVCDAVQELLTTGLLILLDDRSLSDGWVQKPWVSKPS